jgi:lipoyl-dependent peroxiredoxin
MKRHATAVWNGSGKEGSGNITTQSPALNKAKYSYKSRFEDGPGTNPEELIAAAHSGCFAMKLAFELGSAGFTPDSLDATAHVTIAEGTITQSHLVLKAKVPGISKEKFNECAEEAKRSCPVSKALNTNITLEAELVS